MVFNKQLIRGAWYMELLELLVRGYSPWHLQSQPLIVISDSYACDESNPTPSVHTTCDKNGAGAGVPGILFRYETDPPSCVSSGFLFMAFSSEIASMLSTLTAPCETQSWNGRRENSQSE
jgi:hypothetical protein